MVWLDGFVQLGVCRLNVGRDDVDVGQVGKEVAQLLVSAVEFVIAKRHGIEAHLVQSLGDLLTAVVGVEQGALEFIAHVEPQAVIVLGSLGINHVFDTSIAAITAALGACAVCARAAVFIKMSMDIVDMEECWKKSVSKSWRRGVRCSQML